MIPFIQRVRSRRIRASRGSAAASAGLTSPRSCSTGIADT
jgi:hypothetical protein